MRAPRRVANTGEQMLLAEPVSGQAERVVRTLLCRRFSANVLPNNTDILSNSGQNSAWDNELELGATRHTDKLAYAGVILMELITMGAQGCVDVFPTIDDKKKSVNETSLFINPCMNDVIGQNLSGRAWLSLPRPEDNAMGLSCLFRAIHFRRQCRSYGSRGTCGPSTL